ncbi:MAG: hypothetical protein AB8G05_04105 [Oligoflexales bacterium]
MNFLAINIVILTLTNSLISCSKPRTSAKKTATFQKSENGGNNKGAPTDSDSKSPSEKESSKSSGKKDGQDPINDGDGDGDGNSNQEKIEDSVLQTRNTCNSTDSFDYNLLKPEKIQEGINAYSFYCSSCHSPIFESEKLGRCASHIVEAFKSVPMANIIDKPSQEKINLISAALNSQSTLETIQAQHLAPKGCRRPYTETEIAESLLQQNKTQLMMQTPKYLSVQIAYMLIT